MATDLLDQLTRLLAYIGDEEAKDGYFIKNNSGNPAYSINIRPEPIAGRIKELVRKIKNLLTKNAPVIDFPENVVAKTTALKALYDRADESGKNELISYLEDFEFNSGMHGGAFKKTKRKSNNRGSKNKSSKNRNNKNKKSRSRK